MLQQGQTLMTPKKSSANSTPPFAVLTPEEVVEEAVEEAEEVAVEAGSGGGGAVLRLQVALRCDLHGWYYGEF